jgi:glyoxylase-like metal-dependent hydrolase (beta-lactamase superfamily II)
MGMRCALIEHDSGLVLIDSGAGNKESQKFIDIYGIENATADGRTMLEAGIRAAGHAPEDVSLVINTHLHFDHAGGNTYKDAGGAVTLTFPNAPVFEAGRFDLLEGEHEVLAGVRVIPTPGHVPFHQGILLTSRGEHAFYLADLAPTSAHLPLPWIMGYDVEPLVTLETKRRIFKRALEEGWRLIFEHDATVATGRLAYDGKTYSLAPEAP